jgi:8-oxo-dGTP pyrophosphatase MutT (NUDIX family)
MTNAAGSQTPKPGHDPSNPIRSYGVIAVRYSGDRPELLMAQKRFTMHFIAFVIGDYRMKDRKFVRGLFRMMVQAEKASIMANSFEHLWFEVNGRNRRKFGEAHRKYLQFAGVYNLSDLCALKEVYSETEWEFPKGRPVRDEDPFQAAFREFREETGIPESDLVKVDRDTFFTESLHGTDGRWYLYIYYLCMARDRDMDQKFNNNREICQLRWIPIDRSADMFRKHYVERKILIRDLGKALRN